MPRLGLGTKRQGRARACRILFKEKAFATQSVRRPWGPPQDLARIVPARFVANPGVDPAVNSNLGRFLAPHTCPTLPFSPNANLVG